MEYPEGWNKRSQTQDMVGYNRYTLDCMIGLVSKESDEAVRNKI